MKLNSFQKTTILAVVAVFALIIIRDYQRYWSVPHIAIPGSEWELIQLIFTDLSICFISGIVFFLVVTLLTRNIKN
jgi:hypothetical protein